MQFITTVDDIDVWNYEVKNDEFVTCARISVTWEMEFECRHWGCKGISVFVKELDSICIVSTDHEGNELYEQWNPKEGDGWTIQTEGVDVLKLDGTVMPHNIGIDFKEKTITVNF